MQQLNWNDLQAFLAIAQAGRLAKAGKTMRLDATTMGRRLRRLESQLGATLFEQTRQGQELTEAGEALLAQVEEMASAAAAIGEGTGGGGSAIGGTLRLSVSEGFGTWFLAKHIPAFAALHPQLTLDLVASSGFLSPSKREVDIAVMLSRPQAGPVIARKLSDYGLRLYASKDYLSEFGTPTAAKDLAQGHRLIGYMPDLIYAPELRYLDEFHPGMVTQARSSSINAQHQLIAAGGGVGVLPCFIGDLDENLEPVIPEKQITRSFWLVMHKDNYQLTRIRAGRDWLVDLVQKHRQVLLPH